MPTPIITYKIPSHVTLDEVASAVYTTTTNLKELNPSLGVNIEGVTIKVQQTMATNTPKHIWPVSGIYFLTEQELRQNLAVLDKLSISRLNSMATTESTQNTSIVGDIGSSLGITTGQSCEPGKFIVEIVGEVSSSYVDQRLLIYNQDGEFDQETTTKLEREKTRSDDQLKTSTLHTWDWDSCNKGQLYLEIAATGGPIHLPLMTEAQTTPRQNGIHSQLNLIVPVIPMTLIKNSYIIGNKLSDDIAVRHTVPVQCRAGWVYIYYQGKLWRELQIQQNQASGEMTYHDVRLAFDRNGNLQDTINHQREPEGKGLTEIWLPARWNDDAQTIQMFYAESQLTALRLNYLQNNPTALSRRSQSRSMIPQLYKAHQYWEANNPLNQPFLLKTNEYEIKNHLPRDPLREKHTTDPSDFLHDTSGTYLKKQFTNAQKALQEFNKDTPEPNKKYEIPLTNLRKGLGPEINVAAFAYQLKEVLLQKAKNSGVTQDPNSPDKISDVLAAKYQSTKDEDDKIWKTEIKMTQVLTKALEKKICGIYLSDPLYDIQYRQTQINISRELQGFIAERASLKEQHGNALLVNNIMYSSKKIDEDNPLYKATKKLGSYGWSKIHFALASEERKRLNDYIDSYNDQLTTLFNSSFVIECFKDLTCYYGIDYLANCEYILNSINHATGKAELTDPLSTAFISKPKETSANQTLEGLFKREAGSGYYKMLFDADYNPVDLLNDYQEPKESIERNGDGSWHPQEIAQLINKDEKELNLSNPMSLQGLYLTNRINTGLEKFLSVDSKLASAILTYVDVLDSTIKKALVTLETDASNTVASETTLLQEEQRKLADLQRDADQLKSEQTKLEQQQKELETAFKQTQSRLNVLETQLFTQKTALYNLDKMLGQDQKTAGEYAKRWGDKTPATITNQEILQWTTTGNELASQVQQTASELKTAQTELAQIQIKRMEIKRLLVAQTEELEGKNRQIAETKGKIQEVQQSPANNKRLRFSKSERYQFISANTARELLDQEIGLRLDEISEAKPLPKERIILGTDPQHVSINGTSLLDNVETNRQKLHSATASVIKIENGQPVVPKGVSPNKIAQAVNQGETVMLSVTTWTVAENKKFWRSYRRELNRLRPALDTMIDEANGMAAKQTAFIRGLKEVNEDIALANKKVEELNAQKQKELNADFEGKIAADTTVAETKRQQIETKASIEQTEKQIGQEMTTGQQQIEQKANNQHRLDELAEKQNDTAVAQHQTQSNIDVSQEQVSRAKNVADTAAADIAAMNKNNFRGLNLGTQEGAVQELATTRNRINITGPLLPAFILGLEVRNISIVWNEDITSIGEARHKANMY